ncbi:MAG: hypothetical protein K0Q95_394 [Bacteroidota bacterium]|jgi:hypothetical protein|nr:hypothetical protein [Bacteroidota bacterium]
MKTTLQIRTTKLSLLLCLTALLLTFSSKAQLKIKGNLGLRVGGTLSANRCGTILAPSVFYSSGRSTILAGITMQRAKKHISGFQLGYEHTLLDPDKNTDCNLDWLELYAWLNGSFHRSIYLSKSMCEEERMGNRELKIEVEKLTFKTVEAYGGFGVRIDLLKNFKWFNAIGIGAYKVFNPHPALYYNKSGVGLMMRTGLSYNICKPKKTKY